MNLDRVQFGNRLREAREARALTLSDIASSTKIPERSVTFLEAGAFESLPADVFVRGFVRAYCRTVGLDAEDMIQSYAELTRKDKGRREYSLTRPAPVTPAAEPARLPAPQAQPADESRIFQALSDAGRGTSRMSLTLAVVILVIVATLTLSLLLRRPSHVGDGVSALPAMPTLAGGPRA